MSGPVKFACPSCKAKGMVETILRGGSVKHEHRACGYLVVWRPRDVTHREDKILRGE